jgi:hypothetical protein
MAGADIVWTLIAGAVTLAIFSFLYKDNPLYKLAEHVAVGVSVGFLIVTYFYNVFLPKVWEKVLYQHQYDYIIPFLLGIILFTRFIPKIGWVSRCSIAFYIGAFSGLSIGQTIEGRVLGQMEATTRSLISRSPDLTVWQNLVRTADSSFLIIGTLACLVFFLFSVEHKGAVGRFAYFGRLCIMAGFGASFGFTVMARVSLLIGRMQYLTRDVVEAVRTIF